MLTPEGRGEKKKEGEGVKARKPVENERKDEGSKSCRMGDDDVRNEEGERAGGEGSKK